MEQVAYFLVCLVAVVALAMIVLVIVSVLKVSSDQDDEYELTERIKFQAQEGLIKRDEYTREDLSMQRRGTHTEGMVEDNRDTSRYTADSDSHIQVATGEGADQSTGQAVCQKGAGREI